MAETSEQRVPPSATTAACLDVVVGRVRDPGALVLTVIGFYAGTMRWE